MLSAGQDVVACTDPRFIVMNGGDSLQNGPHSCRPHMLSAEARMVLLVLICSLFVMYGENSLWNGPRYAVPTCSVQRPRCCYSYQPAALCWYLSFSDVVLQHALALFHSPTLQSGQKAPLGQTGLVYVAQVVLLSKMLLFRVLKRAWLHGLCVFAGQGVVLTSHSMEECEALCGRLAIMSQVHKGTCVLKVAFASAGSLN